MTTVLAIDQGTSGTKACVVSDGSIVAEAEVPIRPQYLPGGAVEQDPEELFRSVVSVANEAAAEAGVGIDAVALANQGESVLVWDPATGEPLSPIVVWQDSRAKGICDELAEHAGLIGDRTGLVLDPYFSAPKMAWLRRNVSTEGVVTTTDTWIIHRLTGAFVTDVATASRSLLVDLATGEWDGDLLRLFGLDGERLPDVVACDTVVGPVQGLDFEAPLAGLVVDQQAALFAERCLQPGQAKCTFGTGAFLLANSGTSRASAGSGLTTSVAWRLRGQQDFCVDGQIYTVASAVRWLADLGLIADAAELDTVATGDSDGVLCVPAFAGLAAPYWRADARASFHQLALSTGRAEIVQAVLDGIAAQVAGLVNTMAADGLGSLDVLRVDGGLTRSRRLMQAVADIAQLRLEVYPATQATALGVAALGALAIDPTLQVDDAVADWQPLAVYEPQWPAIRAQQFLAEWDAAVVAEQRRQEVGGS